MSPLFEQVRFRESWRGYDPAEVDAYIARVEEAAVWARRRIATLSELADAGPAGADDPFETGPETPSAPESPTAEAPAGSPAPVEVYADEAAATAREQAKQMLADAEDRARALIGGATAEGMRIRREADEYAASTLADVESRAAEREQHAAAVAELAAERARREERLELFVRQVAERREEVEGSLSRLVEVVESAEILQAVHVPPEGHCTSAVADLGEASGAADPAEPDAADAESVESDQGRPKFVTLEDLQERSGRHDSVESSGSEPAPSHSQLFDEAELSFSAARMREEEPFLAQLREAATRDSIRTDTDDALSAFFNQDEDQRRPPWFLGGR